ncbi:MAG: Gfo/Idh/MocA family oxidoreductase [Flavobacteriales bacterium]|nr:Gfo/Idh/MocA family oxidoreductase [Flavobacteriales bacterium]MCW8912011.1 Gfo/Idh/MocA family oxidoreductase [Flavobacteriales bacterium]MCW8936651.1 Gfo/Idh/MocA family oxidoreductase [Flavobacteriales bacterium]MCW8940024.1 Gfo/Idh/MocA family oxidoreductase [Flavobacteriales bacterium]MCW8969599.1 Gfo/Idh/MocA family oxidoreductase [Flavobacteriales bacterium]
MQKLKIGVLGCANIAKKSVIPAILSISDFELVAVASRTAEKAQEFANLFGCEAVEGYQKLIDKKDIDIIYMPLPTGLHEEWVLKALEAGKHILIEKSLAMNYSSAEKMVQKAKEKGLLIMENFMFVYHGQHQIVKQLIAEDKIGEIRCFRSSFGFPPLPSDNFRYNKKLGGGALLDAAAYTIRASQLFLDNDLNVKAASLNYNENDIDIFGGAFLKNKNGLFSEVAFGFDNFYQCNYEIWGSKGKIIAHRAFTPAPDFKPLITIEQQEEKFDIEVPAENHFINILHEFVKNIRKQNYKPKYDEILNQAKLIQEIRDIAI